ncbi:hypothetical protein PLANTIT3_90076 [Plantibacter sp. T3]|nr:hypothetical protein PLANTIT3_90076 [Plantibacter sp. T3]
MSSDARSLHARRSADAGLLGASEVGDSFGVADDPHADADSTTITASPALIPTDRIPAPLIPMRRDYRWRAPNAHGGGWKRRRADAITEPRSSL